MSKWRPPNLNELTPNLFGMELTKTETCLISNLSKRTNARPCYKYNHRQNSFFTKK